MIYTRLHKPTDDHNPHVARREIVLLDTKGHTPPLQVAVAHPEGLGRLGFVAPVFGYVLNNNGLFGLPHEVG